MTVPRTVRAVVRGAGLPVAAATSAAILAVRPGRAASSARTASMPSAARFRSAACSALKLPEAAALVAAVKARISPSSAVRSSSERALRFVGMTGNDIEEAPRGTGARTPT